MQSTTINKYYKWLDYIMPVYFCVALIEFYFGLWRLTTLVKFISILITIVIVFNLYKVNNNNRGMKSVLSIFIVFNLLTGVFYLWNDRPFACYLNDLMNYIPAMLFMYAGMFDKRTDRSFYKLFLIFCTVSMVLGLLLYVTAPGWYVSRSIEIYNSQWFANERYSEESYLDYLRFTSYLGSEYAVIYLGMAAYCTALFFLYCKHNNLNKKQRLYCIFSVIVLLVAFFLSQMRVAMVFSVFLLLFYFVRGFLYGRGKVTGKLLFYTLLVAALAVLFISSKYGDRIDSLKEMVFGRVKEITLEDVTYGRDNQLLTLMSTWEYYILGHGLGSGGSVAVAYGYPGVTDLQYIKTLFETGIVGLLFFLFIIFSTFFRAIRNIKYYMIEVGIIGFIMLAMIGGNTLSLGYLYILPFWYAMGMVWNGDYLTYAKKNKIYV